tara:strand:- start:866 stop:1414 length:549 start_codon:yes stop_codon:yes gene_type:complete
MILATQRPSVDIITGVIKANLPCRMAFQVASRHDSRTILDQMGAEKLLGQGDLLYLKPGRQKFQRIQGAFVSDQEVNSLVDSLKTAASNFDEEALKWMEGSISKGEDVGYEPGDENSEVIDSRYGEALEIAKTNGYISTSYIQRRLQIGYNRAARIVEMMEKEKLITAADGIKPRKWINQYE